MQVTLNVVEGGCWCNDGLQVWVFRKLPFNYWDFYDIAAFCRVYRKYCISMCISWEKMSGEQHLSSHWHERRKWEGFSLVKLITDLWPAVTPASKRGRVKFQAWNLKNAKPCAAGAPVLSADTIYESYPFPTTRVISGSDVNLRLKFPGASPKVCMATAPTPPSSAG